MGSDGGWCGARDKLHGVGRHDIRVVVLRWQHINVDNSGREYTLFPQWGCRCGIHLLSEYVDVHGRRWNGCCWNGMLFNGVCIRLSLL